MQLKARLYDSVFFFQYSHLAHKYLISCSPWAPLVRSVKYYKPEYNSQALVGFPFCAKLTLYRAERACQLCGEAGKVRAGKYSRARHAIPMLGLKT